MSDFCLPEIADRIGKDARTLRRWCASGQVAGAFQTPGGHWRVKAPSLAVAASRALAGTRGFARSRKGLGAVIIVDGIEVPCHVAEFVEKSGLVGHDGPIDIPRSIPPAPRGVLAWAARERREVNKEARLLHPTLRESYFGGERRQVPINAEILGKMVHRDPIVTGLVIAMIADGTLRPVATVADSFGITLRTFYRRFGKYLKDARLAAYHFILEKNVTPQSKIYYDEAGGVVDTVDFDYSEVDRRLGA